MEINPAILLKSQHHGNTERVAKAISEEFGIPILDPLEIPPEEALRFDLLLFASGIYFWNLHPDLLYFAKKLPPARGKAAAIISTAGLPSLRWHRNLRGILKEKGFRILGELSLPGYDTYGVLKFIGGIRRGRPGEEDLKKAKEFFAFIEKKWPS
ncbi:MAG: flavodoxin family protein [Caldiserica bacterium]|jgi:flavodoxin|nr:flavodoxin family protein [Caldisericota bacterium]MDH7562035.1 flavodoxin family protein [Caldisericota bacterium]